jgi:excisionase family DNA binding protein
MGMDKNANEADLDKILTISEAAKLLGMSYKTAHHHVVNGDLKGMKKGGRYLIPRTEIENFKRSLGGQPRKNVPPWRFAPEGHKLIVTNVEVRLREKITKEDLIRALEPIKRDESYRFPGTIARYVLGQAEAEDLRRLEILLIWRESSMPSSAEIEAELAALGKALSAVLDWDTARVRTRRVWMHT